MTDFAKLVLDADTTGLGRGEKALDSITSKAAMTAQNIGKSLQSAGTKLSIGVTAPLVLFGKQAFQSAVDAQEMESAFDTVFGNMSDSVRQWAETTGDSLGRSTQELQRGALAFEELFSKALEPAQSADLSKTFAVLTQDLASFKNLSNEVAQQKLFAGLTGEAEPLRAVGVFINDAAVQSKALELGLEQVNGKFTDQNKIIARAALIQEQLAQASGDVVRTGDSTANQIKESQAAYEELSIILGTKLLPALTPIISTVGAILTSFAGLDDSVQTFIVGAAVVAATLGPVLAIFGTLLTLAPAVATGIGLIKTAMLALFANPILLGAAAIITGIVLAWQNWDKIEAIVTNVGNAISAWWTQNIQPTFDFVKSGIDVVVDYFDRVFGDGIRSTVSIITQIFDGDFRGAWDRIGPIVKGAVKAGLVAFVELHIGAARQIASLAADMVGFGRDIINGLISGIKAAPQAVWNALKSVIGFGVDNFKRFLGINSPSKLFMEFGGFVADGLAIGIIDGTPTVKAAADRMALAVGQSVDSIKEKLDSVGFGNVATQETDLDGFGINIGQSVSDATRGIAPAFKSEVSDPLLANIETIARGFADLVVDVEGSIKGLVSSFKDGDIVGIIVGVADTIASIAGAISSIKGGFSGGQSFDGGGFTGNGPRSGGLDGKGGFMAMLHPQETVIDHSRGQQMPNSGGGSMKIEVVPSQYFNVIVDNRAANVAMPIASGAGQSARQGAQADIARRQRKSLS